MAYTLIPPPSARRRFTLFPPFTAEELERVRLRATRDEPREPAPPPLKVPTEKEAAWLRRYIGEKRAAELGYEWPGPEPLRGFAEPIRPGRGVAAGALRGFITGLGAPAVGATEARAEAERRHAVFAKRTVEEERRAEIAPGRPEKIAEVGGELVGFALGPVRALGVIRGPLMRALGPVMGRIASARLAPVLTRVATVGGEGAAYGLADALARNHDRIAEMDPKDAAKLIGTSMGLHGAAFAGFSASFEGLAAAVRSGVLTKQALNEVSGAMRELSKTRGVPVWQRPERVAAERRAAETVYRGREARAAAPPTGPERGVLLERPAPPDALGLPPGGLEVARPAPARARVETAAERRARLSEAIEQARAERSRLEGRVRRMPRAGGGVVLGEPTAPRPAAEIVLPGRPTPREPGELIVPREARPITRPKVEAPEVTPPPVATPPAAAPRPVLPVEPPLSVTAPRSPLHDRIAELDAMRPQARRDLARQLGFKTDDEAYRTLLTGKQPPLAKGETWRLRALQQAEAPPAAPELPREHPTIEAIRARRGAPKERPEVLIETQPVAPELALAGEKAAAPPVRVGMQETLITPLPGAGKAAPASVVGQMTVGQSAIMGSIQPKFTTQFGPFYDLVVRRNSASEWSITAQSHNITHAVGTFSTPKALLDRVDTILREAPTIEGLGGRRGIPTAPIRPPRDYREVFEKKQVFRGERGVPREGYTRLSKSEKKLNQQYAEHLQREAELAARPPEAPPVAPPTPPVRPAPAVEEFLNLPKEQRKAVSEAVEAVSEAFEGQRGRKTYKKIADVAYVHYLDNAPAPRSPAVTPQWIARYLREAEASQARIVAPPPVAPGPAAPVGPPAPAPAPVTDIGDLVDYIRRVVPVRWKRLGRVKAGELGRYWKGSEVVRAKTAFDLDTTAHEVGHHLDKHFGLVRSPHLAETLPLLRVNVASYKPHQIPAEQVAEFTRTWLTDPAAARRTAPNFAREFEANLAGRPEWKQALEMAQDGIRAWKEQPARNRILGRIVLDPARKEPLSVGRFLQEFEDRLLPIQAAVREMSQGRSVPASKDPYKLGRIYPGQWAGRAHTWAFGKRTDRMGKVVGPSLEEIYAPVKGVFDDFRAYNVALHAEHLHKLGIKTGFDPADVAETIRTLKSPTMDRVVQQRVEFRNALLDEMVDVGFLRAEVAARFKRRYPYYVSMRRFFEEAGRPGRGRPGERFIDIPQPIKAIHGSARRIVDPIESDMRATYVLHALIEQNRVGRAFVDLAERFPGGGRFAERIPPPVRAMKFSLREIEKVLERAGADLSQADLDRFVTVFRPTGTGLARESIGIVWRGGKPNYYQFDPGIYNAFKTMDTTTVNAAVKLLSYPASILRAGAVGLNPEWAAPNVFRDQLTAAVYSRFGFIPGVDLARGIFHTAGKTNLYWQYRSTGGPISSIVAVDQDAMRVAIRQFQANPGVFGKFKAVVMHPIEAMRTLTSISDELTRLGEFRRAPRRTMDEIVDAALASRNIILDYQRAGRTGRDINRIWAFWNAQVQGLSQFVREHRARPVQVATKGVLYVTLPTVLMYLQNRNDPEWKAAPRWLKDSMWSFRIGGRRIWVPKPFLVGLVYGSIPERILEHIDTQDPEALKTLAQRLGRQVFEPVPVRMVGTIPVPMADLAAIRPAVELLANYDLFRDRPIVPLSEQRLPPRLQYGPYTPTLAVEVGKRLGISPRKIEHMVGGYAGGVGRMALELPEKVGLLPDRPGAVTDRGAERAWVVRRFHRPAFAQPADVDEFYQRYQELQAEVAGLRKEGRLPPTTVGRRRVVSRHPLDLQLQGMAKAAKLLSDIRKTRDLVLRSTKLSDEEKQGRIRNLDLRAITIARRALRKPPITEPVRGLEDLIERVRR